jgi:hypothetical protein
MAVATDCKEYHTACSRVKEYMSRFNFLNIFRYYNKTKIVDTVSKYLEQLPENQQRFKLNAIRTFSTLTYFAWKGRKEYRDKYNLEHLPGYEYQINFMYELYDKSRVVVKKLYTDLTLKNEDTKVEHITQVEIDDEFEHITQAEIDDEFEGITIPNDTDVQFDDDIIERKVFEDSDEDEYLKQIVRASSKESLCYILIENHVTASLNEDMFNVINNIRRKSKCCEGQIYNLACAWFKTILNKVFTDNRRRRLLFKQYKYSNGIVESSNEVNFTYDEFLYIYNKIKDNRYPSPIVFNDYVSLFNTTCTTTVSTDKECIGAAYITFKTNFTRLICNDIREKKYKLGYNPKTLKEMYPQKSDNTIQILMRVLNFDDHIFKEYLEGKTITVEFKNSTPKDFDTLYLQFKDLVPISIQKLYSQILSFIRIIS